MTTQKLESYFVGTDASLKDVLAKINENKDGIALVVDGERRLVGTVTDGDIRRFLLKSGTLDAPACDFMSSKSVTASVASCEEDLVDLLKKFRLRNVPLVDDDGRVCGLANLRDLITQRSDFAQPVVVVMAGPERTSMPSVPQPSKLPAGTSASGTSAISRITRVFSSPAICTICPAS